MPDGNERTGGLFWAGLPDPWKENALADVDPVPAVSPKVSNIPGGYAGINSTAGHILAHSVDVAHPVLGELDGGHSRP